MAIKQLEDGRIADEFEIGDGPHVLKDALIMTLEAHSALSLDELQAMKQARYDRWLALVTAPQIDEPPTDATV